MTRKAFVAAFTLLELLVATSVLAMIVLLLTWFLSGVSRAWAHGEQQTAEFQDGRAILELISRELAQAVVSPRLQFIHDPSLNNAPQRANSDSIFWQAPAASTTSGNLAEIGYYLSEDNSLSGSDIYQLKRFYVAPTDSNYQIFTPPNVSDNSAPWVTNFVKSTPSLSTTVASGVLAFWARCLDCNGDPIPWPPANAGERFNSAAHFQPAVPGQPSSFKYTNAATTVRANLLPASVELMVVTLDPKTFSRNPSIPALPAQNNQNDLPTVRDIFNQQLIANNINTAHTFAARVPLMNATR